MTEKERIQAELERDKRKWQIRRRVAVTAFVKMCLVSAFYMLAPLCMTLEQAKILSDFNSIIITILGTDASIVLLYIGAVTYSDKNVQIKTS